MEKSTSDDKMPDHEFGNEACREDVQEGEAPNAQKLWSPLFFTAAIGMALFWSCFFTMLMRMAYSRKVKEIKKWSDTAASFGREKQKRMLLYFMRMVRENFMFNFHQPELVYMTTEEQKFATRCSPFINEANVIEINDLFARALRDISQNANSKIVMYDMALKLIVSLIRKP